MNTVIFEKLYPDVEVPVRATTGSAAYDLKAHTKSRELKVWTPDNQERVYNCGECGSINIGPGERMLVPLGFKMTLPKNCEGRISIRSSVALKKGLQVPNSPGVIDEDYDDEVCVILLNTAAVPVAIKHLERIAQMKISEYQVPIWTEGTVVRTTDRDGGLGSTGQ